LKHSFLQVFHIASGFMNYFACVEAGIWCVIVLVGQES
jgi:hypothetical protein